MNEVKKTQETYTKIAASYAEAWQDRGTIRPHLAQFADLVGVGGLVFDVGCGPGFDTAVLQTHQLRTVDLDYNWQMMHTGRSQLTQPIDFTQIDMRRLPLPANCANGLWVCASLLHIPRTDVPATLREFYRVLQPGGILYLSVKQGDGSQWAEQSYGHTAARFYTFWQPDSFDTALETAVFHIIDGWIDNTPRNNWIVRLAQKR